MSELDHSGSQAFNYYSSSLIIYYIGNNQERIYTEEENLKGGPEHLISDVNQQNEHVQPQYEVVQPMITGQIDPNSSKEENFDMTSNIVYDQVRCIKMIPNDSYATCVHN